MPNSVFDCNTMNQPWDRQNNEPALWYNRFDVFRLLGPRRSIERTYNVCKDSDSLTAPRPGANWYDVAKRYNWSARAEAWDEQERDRLREIDNHRREDARNQRIDMINVVLDTVFERLISDLRLPDNTDISTFRLIFKDMLAAQRADLPFLPVAVSDPESLVQLTADDLLSAQRELAHWRDAVRSADGSAPRFLQLRACLVRLYPDPVSARRVAEQSGLDISRVEFSDRSVDTWHAILSEAERNDQLSDVLSVAKSEYPNSKELHSLCQNHTIHRN